ncbi:class I SAM-dependent methyltransferase [Alkalibacter saccharofermentans]|uniref:Methyltransferase domain-containing protein n=1 Tax=Alkalibacter saccharofermentans DSM 14828 TaxID=1120975 RepID=A0A1M4WE98_9FIRM|nr:class I SAM-dependent methyltransferase [Alkalibacter saccharofermentans]SHE79517.1 Methyltransferase domain-containing protein [Alkalibacter saccharofermentans DSM 14828]
MSIKKSTDIGVLKDVKDYWNKRSDSYSKQNIAELHSFKRDVWKKIILENAPRKDKLKILDVGTGPGFFAINLALEGHDVTAVDCTEGMLEKAKENAKVYGADVRFDKANAHQLPFVDEEFDLVVSRNVVWNLESPRAALKEWSRVLANDGRILYYDANWYLYLFDEKLKEEYRKCQQEADRLYPDDCPSRTIGVNMEKIAYNLPLSKVQRPDWDMGALESCGMSVLKVDENIGDKVWEEKEKIRYKSTPMFMLCAQKHQEN